MKNIDIDILMGQKFYDDGDYKKCIEKLSQDKYLNNDDVLLLIAVSYKILTEYEKSLKVLAYICNRNAQYVPAYIQQAYIYKEKQLYVDEINLLLNIIELIKAQQKNRNEIYVDKYSEVYSMLGSAYVKLGDSKNACYYFLSSSKNEKDKALKIKEYSNALFAANYIHNISDKALYKLHVKYQSFFNNVTPYQHFRNNKDNSKIKIGYISPDFRNHPVMAWAISFLLKFNRNKFEVYCYSAGTEDEFTEKLKKISALNWNNIIGFTPQQSAESIYNDNIDILFDLSGHTANNCLPILAYKPAPLQISGIGYFNTTGLESVDYFLSDKYCLPNEKSTGFVEKVIYMPQSHMCYTPLVQMPEIQISPCVKNKYITFGCFNNFNKVNNFILQLWSQILNKLPTARLVLKSQLFNSKQGIEYAEKIFRKYKLPIERIELRAFTEQYLQEYNDIDIALDTYPYTGGVTSCESLYMGVPVITLCGTRHGSRFGYSILKNVELDDCIAYSKNEYIDRVIALAKDIDKLSVLRKKLRIKMQNSPIMNDVKYMENIEFIYQMIWRRHIHDRYSYDS